MAVFRYEASDPKGEEFTEMGVVVAKNDDAAKQKLKALNFSEVKLKRLKGIDAIFKQFTADVR